eukprot:5141922-Prymnesium_polylepis.1
MRNGCETGPGRFISKHYWVQIVSVHLHPFRYTTPTSLVRAHRGAFFRIASAPSHRIASHRIGAPQGARSARYRHTAHHRP